MSVAITGAWSDGRSSLRGSTSIAQAVHFPARRIPGPALWAPSPNLLWNWCAFTHSPARVMPVPRCFRRGTDETVR